MANTYTIVPDNYACSSITDCVAVDGCASNQGGIEFVYLCNFNDVVGFTTDGATGTDNGTITGITGPTSQFFYSFTGRRNTASGTDDWTVSDNGSGFYTQTLNVIIPKQDREKREQFMLLNKGRVMALVKDNNGLWWLFGGDKGMLVSTNSAATGTASTDLNGYTFALTAEERFPAFPVNTTLAESIIATCS